MSSVDFTNRIFPKWEKCKGKTHHENIPHGKSISGNLRDTMTKRMRHPSAHQCLAKELLLLERKAKGVQELAKEVGCSFSSISRWLSDKEERPITEPYATKIIQRYGRVETDKLAELLSLLAERPEILPALLKIVKSPDEESKKTTLDMILMAARQIK